MNKKLIAALAGSFFYLMGFAAVAHDAEPTLEKIARTGEFVIGYRADASPLSYENGDGDPSGYSVDLCRRIAASAGAFGAVVSIASYVNGVFDAAHTQMANGGISAK